MVPTHMQCALLAHTLLNSYEKPSFCLLVGKRGGLEGALGYCLACWKCKLEMFVPLS